MQPATPDQSASRVLKFVALGVMGMVVLCGLCGSALFALLLLTGGLGAQ